MEKWKAYLISNLLYNRVDRIKFNRPHFGIFLCEKEVMKKKEVLKLIEVLVLHSLFCLYIRVERNTLQRIKVTEVEFKKHKSSFVSSPREMKIETS